MFLSPSQVQQQDKKKKDRRKRGRRRRSGKEEPEENANSVFSFVFLCLLIELIATVALDQPVQIRERQTFV